MYISALLLHQQADIVEYMLQMETMKLYIMRKSILPQHLQMHKLRMNILLKKGGKLKQVHTEVCIIMRFHIRWYIKL